MEGEFTNYCSSYYRLTELLDAQETRFQSLLENALPYAGQTHLNELDAILHCNRKIQKAFADVNDTVSTMHETERTILQIMRYFELTPNTKLTCVIPGELEFEIWADEQDVVHCLKTKQLAPLEEDPNIINIRINNSRYALTDDEDED
jgi:hypothetical protein